MNSARRPGCMSREASSRPLRRARPRTYNECFMNPDMPKLAIALGLVLVVLGVAVYFASGQASLTALIPLPFGAAMALLGAVARRPAYTKHAMHAAAVVALAGLLGSVDALPDLVRMLLGAAVERPLAVGAKSVMAADLGVFLAYCVRSFRQARKAAN